MSKNNAVPINDFHNVYTLITRKFSWGKLKNIYILIRIKCIWFGNQFSTPINCKCNKSLLNTYGKYKLKCACVEKRAVFVILLFLNIFMDVCEFLRWKLVFYKLLKYVFIIVLKLLSGILVLEDLYIFFKETICKSYHKNAIRKAIY